MWELSFVIPEDIHVTSYMQSAYQGRGTEQISLFRSYSVKGTDKAVPVLN
jgi:hypothetical protein